MEPVRLKLNLRMFFEPEALADRPTLVAEVVKTFGGLFDAAESLDDFRYGKACFLPIKTLDRKWDDLLAEPRRRKSASASGSVSFKLTLDRVSIVHVEKMEPKLSPSPFVLRPLGDHSHDLI